MEARKTSSEGAFVIGIGIAAMGALLLSWRAKAAPSLPPGLASLFGVVTDAQTNQPVAGVLVGLQGIGDALTDTSGSYLFEEIESGSYAITFSKSGYETIAF